MDKRVEKTNSIKPSIPPDAYLANYYRSDCHGHKEFKATRGDILPKRLAYPLKLAHLVPKMRVLDLGCGRGELTLHCARSGALAWGLDYSHQALNITKELAPDRAQQKMAFQRASAVQLPFTSDSFDIVFMLDIVEHLYPPELTAALDEVRRVLKVDGRLIIHTMPNLWYYDFGYPIYRIFQMLRGKKLPKDPRARGAYPHLHVNEQTPWRLKKALNTCQLQSRVWLKDVQDYNHEPNHFVLRGMRWLTATLPFKWIFCNDILAIGTKRS